mmetsp:Transcript_110934/g.357863  ORF Transcript_110934/g.357863 Transcript_110934/m.357863 type:complete len:201 (+) Transcript_110934:302-904(+)
MVCPKVRRREMLVGARGIECFQCRENRQGANKEAKCGSHADCMTYEKWEFSWCGDGLCWNERSHSRCSDDMCQSRGQEEIWYSNAGIGCKMCNEVAITALNMEKEESCVDERWNESACEDLMEPGKEDKERAHMCKDMLQGYIGCLMEQTPPPSATDIATLHVKLRPFLERFEEILSGGGGRCIMIPRDKAERLQAQRCV